MLLELQVSGQMCKVDDAEENDKGCTPYLILSRNPGHAVRGTAERLDSYKLQCKPDLGLRETLIDSKQPIELK